MSLEKLPVWLDRVSVKQKMKHWLDYGTGVFVVKYLNSYESEDLIAWTKTQAGTRKHIDVHFRTDLTSTFTVLKDIADKFNPTEFVKFREFEQQQAKLNLEQMKRVTISQTVGGSVEAEGNINFDTIKLTAEVDSNAEIIKRDFFESIISDALPVFLQDMQLALGKRKIILCIRLQGKGFQEVPAKKADWFRHKFIKALKELPGASLYLCLLCELDWGELEREAAYRFRAEINNLSYDDMLEVASPLMENPEVYCDGAVDLNREIDYRLFKMKLERKLETIQ